MHKFYLLLVAGMLVCGLAGAQELTVRSYLFPQDTYGSGKLLVDGNDVWAATNSGAFKFNGGAWQIIEEDDGLPSDSLAQIAKDIHGNVWFLTDDGVGIRRPDNTWEYPGQYGWGSMVKRLGDDIWLNTNYTNLVKFEPSGATTTYDDRHGLTSNTRDMEVDSHGNYYAMDYDHLYTLVNGQFVIDERAWKRAATDIMITRSDVLYYAHEGGVLVDKGNAQFDELQIDHIGSGRVQAMAEGVDGTLYFATLKGLVIYKNNVSRLYDETNGLPGSRVEDVAVDKYGNVWCTVRSYNNTAKMHLVTLPYSIANDPSYLHGIVYNDLNHDGVQNQGERGVANQFIHLMPRDAYAVTNLDGKFSFISQAGENTITWQPHGWYEAAESPTSYTFTSPDDDGQHFTIGIAVKPVHAMSAVFYNGATRPGFTVDYTLRVINEGSLSEIPDITFTYDARLEYVESDIAPTEHTGATLRWNSLEIASQSSSTWTARFRIPATTPLRTELAATLAVPALPDEANTKDNSYTATSIVSGSFDPNDKLVAEGILQQRYVEMGTPLHYTIRFQNTGTDTAFTVRVTDELDPKLDLTSLEVLQLSHPAEYVLDGRTLTFHFNNILLPDSTRDERNSHGYIQYRIKPISKMTDRTEVRNKASIYFDFNEPVVTNETVNTYVFELPVNTPLGTAEDMKLGVVTYPNPVRDGNLVVVSKNGEALKGTVTLTSLAGSPLRAAALQGARSVVDVKGVAPGMYVLQVDNRGVKSTRKIVIVQE
jgi:uncharacterized repeat protein (TIGR01451 family)